MFVVRTLPLALLVLSTDALAASDKGACRKARREATIDAWSRYVVDHPDGVCEDEALGQMIVLGVGRIASGLTGDPAKFALTMAQLGHLDDADFERFRELMGGLGGLGGLGGGGLGGGGLGGLGLGGLGGGLGALGGPDLGGLGAGSDYGSLLGDYGDAGGLLGTLSEGGSDDAIYVSFAVVSTTGGWSADAFTAVLDGARVGLQECWKQSALPLSSMNYDVAFSANAGKVGVQTITQTYAADGAPHAEVEACVKGAFEAMALPSDTTGTYVYRVELY